MSALRPCLNFFIDSLPDTPIRSTVRIIENIGFTTVPEKNTSYEYVYRTPHEGDVAYQKEKAIDLQEVIERISASEQGSLEFWSPDGFQFSIHFDLHQVGSKSKVAVRILGSHANIYSTDKHSFQLVEHRTETLVGLFVRFVNLFNPWYAFTHVYDETPLGIFPEDYPPESGIERLPWLSFFGSEWVNHFGGRKRILEAPAWQVQSLDTGILIREHDFPTESYADIDRGPPLSTYEFLFEQRSLSELRAERQQKQNTVRDPFLELNPGDRGCDIIACKTHTSIDTTRIDYREIAERFDTSDRCYVLWVQRDEHDRLWEVDTGMFVRRLIDPSGTPIGERPEQVPPERELVSLSVRNELDPWPVEFFEMKHVDEPSIAAKLFGLHRVPADGFWRNGDECPRELLEDSE
ncbi:hypothetical protein [Natronorubrum thiooxidans]|uniref:Uncharacterized protein n=1 Tax=Natronorubrum thiooxidans TaxID=308853 RepID=A0A1N7H3Z4_9EURY|nr:hypothetical protein [Natronorubrum thiooxidans]SIS19562.1 hypothetical protein SAMN05421752_12322 [Natronorubrum thiooxidans]